MNATKKPTKHSVRSEWLPWKLLASVFWSEGKDL